MFTVSVCDRKIFKNSKVRCYSNLAGSEKDNHEIVQAKTHQTRGFPIRQHPGTKKRETINKLFETFVTWNITGELKT